MPTELTRQGRRRKRSQSTGRRSTGLYESDPNLMLGLARAQFAAGAFSDARATLDSLIGHNPEFRSPDGHLLYARALEAEGNLRQGAGRVCSAAQILLPAPKHRCVYAQLLRAAGRNDEARRVLKELLEHARLAPRYYRKHAAAMAVERRARARHALRPVSPADAASAAAAAAA